MTIAFAECSARMGILVAKTRQRWTARCATTAYEFHDLRWSWLDIWWHLDWLQLCIGHLPSIEIWIDIWQCCRIGRLPSHEQQQMFLRQHPFPSHVIKPFDCTTYVCFSPAMPWSAFCHEQHNILHHRTGNVAWSQSNFFFSDVKHWGCTCFITSGFLPFFQHTVKMTFWTVRTYTIWMAWDIPFWNLLWQAVATQTTGISNGSYTFWFNQFTTSTAKEAFHVWYLTCNVVYPEVRNHLKLASSMQALLFLEPQNIDKTINAIVH